MKNRTELAKFFAELGFKKGVEVGVCTGRYSRILLENIPGLQLMGIDPYAPYGGGGSFRHQETHDSNFREAQRVLFDYPDRYILTVAYAHEVAPWIADESLDFVFIDGMHDYDSVSQDISDWAPRVRRGGVVSGHDYYLTKRMRVKEAVDDYAAKHGIKIQSTGWDESAHRDDRQPDWYFQK